MKKTLLPLLALSAFGCAEKTDSIELKTSAIRAEYTVLAQSGDYTAATKASALFYHGNDVVVLTDGDYAEVTQVGGDTKRLTKAADDYTATFDTQEEDTEFVFSLYRAADGDIDAPDSRVSLPPALVVEGMEDNGEVQENGEVRISRSSSITLTWKQGGTEDEVNYGINSGSDCLWFKDVSSGQKNTGTITIPSDVFETRAGEEDSTCGAALYVELERRGKRDDAFKSGTVRGKHRYWINFVSTP